MNKSESKYFNTAVLMNEALLFLLEKKDFEFISVKEICNKAGVSRSTFYLHYESMNDLLIETIGLINKKFNDSFNNKVVDASYADRKDLFFITEEYLLPYLELVKKHKHVFKLIHNKPFLFGNERESKELYNKLFEKILDSYGVKDEDKEYVFAYYTQGTLAIVLKWIEKDCLDSIERVSELIINMINHKE